MKKETALKIIICLLVLVILALTGYSYLKNSTNKTFLPIGGVIINQKLQCPKYINCMPSPGVTTSCKIPKGCEGYTAGAY